MNIEDTNEILGLFQKGDRPGRISRKTGIPVTEVCRVIAEASKGIRSFKVKKYDGFGPPHLQRYMVARRSPWTDWDNPSGIEKARQDYDAGLVEMCQGKDGDIIIQYSIPRVFPAPARAHFSAPRGE
jgi:hypothetical protein